jgi:hypothetical protein
VRGEGAEEWLNGYSLWMVSIDVVAVLVLGCLQLWSSPLAYTDNDSVEFELPLQQHMAPAGAICYLTNGTTCCTIANRGLPAHSSLKQLQLQPHAALCLLHQ